MRVATFGVLALASAAYAQNVTFLTDFLSTLQRFNLSSTAEVASRINGTATGQFLLKVLGTAPQTIFVPNNNACACIHLRFLLHY